MTLNKVFLFLTFGLEVTNFFIGRAQLYLQLEATHKENAENGAKFNVFGALTTADTWIFIVYNGKNFYETYKCTVSGSPKFANLNVVVDWLVAILDYIDDEKK